MADDINAIELLEKFNQDEKSQLLIEKYRRKSFPELFSISRREVSHSAFLSKVFDEKSFHELGTLPFVLLLRTMYKRARTQGNPSMNAISQQLLVDENFVNDVRIDTEVITKNPNFKNDGRADIVLKANIISPKVTDYSSITIVLENKVYSRESDSQTKKYYDYFESIRNTSELVLYVYLTPKPAIELDSLKEAECSCKKFIQINYQDVLDNILIPMKNRTDSTRAKFILDEYIDSLAISFEDIDSLEKNSNHKKTIIMAISPGDRDLLSAFFEHNKELIEASLTALSMDAEQDDDVIDDAKSLLSAINKLNSRDKTKYLLDGKKFGKGKLVLAVVTDYANKHPKSADVKAAFKPKNSDIIVPSDSVVRKNNKKRFFDEPAELLHLEDGDFAVDHEWGQGEAFNKFLDQAKQAGYSVTPVL